MYAYLCTCINPLAMTPHISDIKFLWHIKPIMQKVFGTHSYTHTHAHRETPKFCLTARNLTSFFFAADVCMTKKGRAGLNLHYKSKVINAQRVSCSA